MVKENRSIGFEDIVFLISEENLNNLDKEEEELLESFTKGEWEKIPDHDAELKKFQEIARVSKKRSAH